MKRAFFTGLALLLPLVLTVLVARWIIRIITNPLANFVSQLFTDSTLHPDLLFFFSQILSLFLFFVILALIGLFANQFLFQSIFNAIDALFGRIPLLSRVYAAFKEVVKSLLHSETTSFQQVVLVPYPSKETLSIGLITQKHFLKRKGEECLVSVLVPGTPNPTIGFVLFFQESDILYTDLPVSSAFQAVISCGSKFDSFKITDNDQKETSHYT